MKSEMELGIDYLVTFGIHVDGKDHQYQMKGKVVKIERLEKYKCTLYGFTVTDQFINNAQYYKPSYVYDNLEEARPALLKDFHYILDWIAI